MCHDASRLLVMFMATEETVKATKEGEAKPAAEVVAEAEAIAEAVTKEPVAIA